MTATLVAGPPCSGKTTFVNKRRKPGDLVVDYDAIMAALTGEAVHEHREEVKRYVYEARDAVLRRWRNRRDVDLWVTATAPTRKDRERYERYGFRVIILDTDERTCVQRALDERPREWVAYIHRWFQEYESPAPAEQVTHQEDIPPAAHVSRRW